MSEHESEGHDRLEAALKQLTPAPPTFEREKVVFLAGRAAGRRARWRLGMLTAFLGVAAGISATYLGMRLMPAETNPRVILVRVGAPGPVAPVPPGAQKAPETQPAAMLSTPERNISSQWDWLFQFARPGEGEGEGYLQMRDQALRWGIETLPAMVPNATAGPGPQPMNFLKMQSELVGKASDL